MTNPLTKNSWSPYVVGAAVGVLSWFAFWSADHPLGITTAFEHTAALAGKAVVPQVEQTHEYYQAKQQEGEPPKIGWEWMLVVGVFIGALLSSRLSGDKTRLKVPDLWQWRFGGSVAKYHVIVGQFLLKDWTVVKTMATAVIVGAIGIYVLLAAGAVSLHIKPMLIGGVVIGAVCFGIGMAVLGYCPGTSVAACGEGRRDAMVGVLGMLCGAGLFVALYPVLQPVMKGLGDKGKITVPETLGISPWLIIGGLVIAAVIALVLIGRGKYGGAGGSLPQGQASKQSRPSA